jgi:3-polyprenyl-4-hydroxybenzoate decarboxylase
MDTTVTTPAVSRQQNMPDFVTAMEQAGLVRIKGAKRVDELPVLTEQHYEKALFIERIQGSEFSFLGNAYPNHAQYAWAARLPPRRNRCADHRTCQEPYQAEDLADCALQDGDPARHCHRPDAPTPVPAP